MSPSTEILKSPSSRLEFNQEMLLEVGKHWNQFFSEIGDHMIEREDLVRQIQLALLAQQHALILGHPGTAKSDISRKVLKRIHEEGKPSLFSLQFHMERRTGEVVGPSLPRTNEKGEMELRRQIKKGIGFRLFAFLDELFDAPPALQRGTLLTVLNERTINDGNEEINIPLRTAFGASNKTLEQLNARFGDELDALLDRFSFIFWTTNGSMRSGSNRKIIGKAGDRKLNPSKNEGLVISPLDIQELDLLREAVGHVQRKMIRENWPLDLAADFFEKYRTINIA